MIWFICLLWDSIVVSSIVYAVQALEFSKWWLVLIPLLLLFPREKLPVENKYDKPI